jgi:hypothetical protein
VQRKHLSVKRAEAIAEDKGLRCRRLLLEVPKLQCEKAKAIGEGENTPALSLSLSLKSLEPGKYNRQKGSQSAKRPRKSLPLNFTSVASGSGQRRLQREKKKKVIWM